MNTSFKTRNKKSAVVSVMSDRAARELSTDSPPDEMGEAKDWRTWCTTDNQGRAITLGDIAKWIVEKEEREETAYYIAGHLQETAPAAHKQISLIVRKLGIDQALTLLEETQAIEAAGGMLLSDLSRRRTPGGVFFYLVRAKHPDLFHSWTTHREAEAKRKAKKAEHAEAGLPAVKPAPPPAINVDIPLDPEQKGTIVKLTLLGRPASRIEDKGTSITFVMQSQKIPTLPKGLPAPDQTKTNYVVHIASKQWRKVAQAIADPEDILIIEGFPQLNIQNGSITVYATNTTTKNLQRAAKDAQRAQAEEQQ